MGNTTKDQRSIEQQEPSSGALISNHIGLGSLTSIDMNGLTEQQVEQLRVKHAEGMLALNQKAQELQIDVGATRANLETLASNVRQIAEDGNAVTITNVQKNALGHTEIIMGNTDTAAKGKLSRAQRGEPDRTLVYVVIGAIVLIVLALILTK